MGIRGADQLALLQCGRQPVGELRDAAPRQHMADQKTIDQRVKEIIVNQLNVNEEQITPQASFLDDLGADSLDTVELVMALEEAFDVEIPDEDAEKIRTVQDAIDYIDKRAKVAK